MATLNPSVAVFDIDLPPGVAFLRSLARVGVEVRTFAADRKAAGRSSRYAGKVRRCPPVHDTDAFVAFLVDAMTDGSIELIAPTSDYVCFAVSAAIDKTGIDPASIGHPAPEAVRDALFKNRFLHAMRDAGFPTPPSATPSSVQDALVAAEVLGYPVVLKPRSHAGVGLRRGAVVTDARTLEMAFRPWRIRPGHDLVLAVEPDVGLPMVQRYFELGTVDVVSITGYLTRDGSLGAVGFARKVSQSPRRLGVGTMFEPVAAPPFADAAVAAVREVLGHGMFELEVLVERATGAPYALDLNPRGFGQMSLDIGRGNDLPVHWYNDVAGTSHASAVTPRRPAELWHDAIGSYIGFGVRFARGPQRLAIARHAWGRLAAPAVGAMFDWRDPIPGCRFLLDHFRHPRSFLRPFLVDTEVLGQGEQVLEDPDRLRDPS